MRLSIDICSKLAALNKQPKCLRANLACKTLRSNKPATILHNIKSAAKQISRSECDHGYVLLNAMNILEHDKAQNQIFTSFAEPFGILRSGLEKIYQSILSDCKSELEEIFKSNTKACPVVITANTTPLNCIVSWEFYLRH